MTKYLKISVASPYINTDRVTYIELEDDDFGENGEVKQKYLDEYVGDAINDYVEAWSDVVDEADVPEEDRAR